MWAHRIYKSKSFRERKGTTWILPAFSTERL
nr:MAG TPA: ACT domain-containing protein [Caudoviricetes sp.]DAF28276.1 MAG TPA: ACT domain-containing protein [Caudoviricetes sp.]DAG30843.1 MAG TPA: ACT domain-containing protein [Caudoviricetes sp.]